MIPIPPFSKTSANNVIGKKQNPVATEKSFGDYLSDTLDKTAHIGKQVEDQASSGITGQSNLVTLMTSLEELGLTVEIITKIQEKAIQAYKDINQMGI